ncbi:MAG: tripartite tricarboxylate transporter substrate binding protein [Ectothiorhodospiraceae bacterium]|nr:tripartite tricarboxylate transporter substrate binding protein [Ectothiorhodospiraceae bacterium]
MRIRRRVFTAALGAAVVATATLGSADVLAQAKYPHETVSLITHSKAGGGTDVFLREMVKHLGKHMGVNFVVENVRGGSGAKAMAKLATSAADGSIFYGTTPTFINTSILSKPKYGYKDLEGMVNVFLDPQIVYVRKASPFSTLREAVDAAKAKPGSIKFGVTTPGSLDRQVMEKLKALTGIEVPIITHDGGGELLISVLNGTVDLGVGEVQELRGQLDAGEVRIIATYTKARLDNFPEVMTAREQGIDLVVNKFRGIAGPKGQPPEVVAAWEKGIQAVLADPDFKAWYEGSSLVAYFIPHAEYDGFLEAFAEDQRQFFTKYGITKD